MRGSHDAFGTSCSATFDLFGSCLTLSDTLEREICLVLAQASLIALIYSCYTVLYPFSSFHFVNNIPSCTAFPPDHARVRPFRSLRLLDLQHNRSRRSLSGVSGTVGVIPCDAMAKRRCVRFFHRRHVSRRKFVTDLALYHDMLHDTVKASHKPQATVKSSYMSRESCAVSDLQCVIC